MPQLTLVLLCQLTCPQSHDQWWSSSTGRMLAWFVIVWAPLLNRQPLMRMCHVS